MNAIINNINPALILLLVMIGIWIFGPEILQLIADLSAPKTIYRRYRSIGTAIGEAHTQEHFDRLFQRIADFQKDYSDDVLSLEYGNRLWAMYESRITYARTRFKSKVDSSGFRGGRLGSPAP